MTPQYAIGQLRHLYHQMTKGLIFDNEKAARSLLSPAISALEEHFTLEPAHKPSEGVLTDFIQLLAMHYGDRRAETESYNDILAACGKAEAVYQQLEVPPEPKKSEEIVLDAATKKALECMESEPNDNFWR